MKKVTVIFIISLILIKTIVYAEGPSVKKEDIPIVPMPPYIEPKDNLPFLGYPEKPKEPVIKDEREQEEN